MRKLYRSRYDRMILGICGGLAQYFQMDPSLMRILTVIVWIFTGFIPLFIVYLIAGMIIPLEPTDHPHGQYTRLYRSRKDRKIAGICGGMAEFLQVDSTFVRLATVFLCLITGIAPLLLAYLIGWALIPEKP